MPLLIELKQRARRLKAEAFALYLAARHPGTPWYAKLLAAAIVAYAFSPVDLIPDFIPVLGYLDDLVLIPLGLALVIRLIPSAVLAECRSAAADAFTPGNKPVSYAAGAFIVMIWLTLAALGMIWLYGVFADAPVSP
ncbi:YkvA family protein [Methylocaldum sp. GT1BB]|jgi:uncharacterized membrane protein YkvA (DUF1232 family)|uniref:YkvA family protein n=1 Tax=Methylocaldum sp. GT1BB TaxID=3438963 RepID=UPI003DA0A5B9